MADSRLPPPCYLPCCAPDNSVRPPPYPGFSPWLFSASYYNNQPYGPRDWRPTAPYFNNYPGSYGTEMMNYPAMISPYLPNDYNTGNNPWSPTLMNATLDLGQPTYIDPLPHTQRYSPMARDIRQFSPAAFPPYQPGLPMMSNQCSTQFGNSPTCGNSPGSFGNSPPVLTTNRMPSNQFVPSKKLFSEPDNFVRAGRSEYTKPGSLFVASRPSILQETDDNNNVLNFSTQYRNCRDDVSAPVSKPGGDDVIEIASVPDPGDVRRETDRNLPECREFCDDVCIMDNDRNDDVTIVNKTSCNHGNLIVIDLDSDDEQTKKSSDLGRLGDVTEREPEIRLHEKYGYADLQTEPITPPNTPSSQWGEFGEKTTNQKRELGDREPTNQIEPEKQIEPMSLPLDFTATTRLDSILTFLLPISPEDRARHIQALSDHSNSPFSFIPKRHNAPSLEELEPSLLSDLQVISLPGPNHLPEMTPEDQESILITVNAEQQNPEVEPPLVEVTSTSSVVKPKRIRRSYTENEEKILNDWYRLQNYQCRMKDIREFSNNTGLTIPHIRNWITNQRRRERRKRKRDEDDVTSQNPAKRLDDKG